MPVQDLLAHDPREIAGHRVLGRLGTGGMGIVYLAASPGGELVALKLVRPELAQDASFRDRFRREVMTARRVSGVCTAPVLAADVDGSQPFVATAFIQGPTLAEEVHHGGPLGGSRLVALAGGLASALVDIHRAGVVHRDLKPGNVILAADGPKVIDFGIAHAADATALTRSGILVGSPGWMAPEQVTGADVGPPADVFLWGATVAFAGTGRPPFGEGRPEAVLYRIVHAEPDLEGLPADLRPLVEDALRKEAHARPAAAGLFTRLTGAATAGATDVTVLLDRTWVGPRPGVDPVVRSADEGGDDNTSLVPTPPPVAAGGKRGRAPALALLAAIAVAAVLALLVVRVVRSGGSKPATSRPPATTAATPVPAPAASPGDTRLVVRTPPDGGYHVKVPASWRLADASAPSDRTTHIWSDPAQPTHKLQVVLSDCASCVGDPSGAGPPHPERVLPPGTRSSFRISPTKIGFAATPGDNPNPDNGVVVVTTDGDRITGFATAELWLPESEHSTATAILNSFGV